MATPKDRLNEIINFLNENDISEIVDFAEFLRAKREKDFWANVPVDEEPVSEAELKTIKEAREEFKRGESLSLEEVFENNE